MANDAPPKGRGKVNEELETFLQSLYKDRPVAYHPMLANALRSVTAAIFLQQLLYWTPRTDDPGGWVYKTRDEIWAETALSRDEQETARKVLKRVGVIDEKRRGVPAKMHYRVMISQLVEVLRAGPQRTSPSGQGGTSASGGSAPAQDRIPAPAPPASSAETAPTSWVQSTQLDGPDPASQSGAIPPTITETTTQITTENDDVVGALRDRGISSPVAQQLAQTYDAADILAKCEVVDWLIATKARQVAKNPPGYLRRSIEQDFQPPPGYKSTAQQAAAAAEQAAALAAQEAALQAQAAEEEHAHRLDLAAVHRRYPPQPIPGTTLTTEQAWTQTLERVAQILSGPNFEMFVKRAVLLRCDGDEAEIGAPTAFDVEQLTSRLNRHITPILSGIIGRPVQCTYVSLVSLMVEGDESTDTEPRHSPSRHHPDQLFPPTGERGAA